MRFIFLSSHKKEKKRKNKRKERGRGVSETLFYYVYCGSAIVQIALSDGSVTSPALDAGMRLHCAQMRFLIAVYLCVISLARLPR